MILSVVLAVADSWDEPAESESAQVDLTGLSLEELLEVEVQTVEGASRYKQDISRAPASISVITAEEIKMFGYRNLAEILRAARGIYVPHDRNYAYLGMRGFNRPGDYNSRVLGLLNGHRLNENIYESLMIGSEGFLDVDLIERVEIIRGPSSSIYGNNAFFGVLNIISRPGREIDGWEASAEGGWYDTYKGRLTYGDQFLDDDVEILFSGSMYGSAGDRNLYYPEFDDPSTNGGRAENSDEDLAYNTFTQVRFHDLTLSGGWSWREKNIPTASFETVFNDGRETSVDARGFASLNYEREVTPDANLGVRVYYDYYRYQGDYPYNVADPGDPSDIVINQDDSLGHWGGAEFQWTQRFADRHTLVVGGEYRENFQQDQENYDTAPTVYYLRDKRQTRNTGFYLQAEAALLTNVLFNAGLRYDYYSSFGGTVNPRTGLIYNPWPDSTFKLLYGQAFRAPNAFELYYESPGLNKRNLDLDPETIRTYELVYEQRLPKQLKLTTSAYYYEVKDLINQTLDASDGLFFFDNLERVEAYGLEMEVEQRLPAGWMARVSYALQQAEDADTGNRLNNSPRHLAKLNLLVPWYQDKIYSGLEVQYTGEMRSFSGGNVDDFFLVNFTLLSRKLWRGWEASATVYNLLDTDYAYPSTLDHTQSEIPQNGISFRIKVTYDF